MILDLDLINEFKEIIRLLIVVISCLITYFLSRKFLTPLIRKIVAKTNSNISTVFFEENVFHYLMYLTPIPIIDASIVWFPAYQYIIEKFILVYTSLILIFLAEKMLTSTFIIYNNHFGEISKKRPIKSFIQAGKFLAYTTGILFILSQIFNKSILTFISGLGALTALLIIVFKDSLLSFKAGIQLIYNDMLRIDDWVEIPKFNADGTVLEISLDTIKVKNWDKTITFIPTYKLMEEPFINWRGMEETGARRIFRSIIIDQHSIRFLSNEDIDKFKKFHLISEYMEEKILEVEKYNRENNIDLSENVNGRKMTNIGTFRIYVLNFLLSHTDINKNQSLVVRQQSPTSEGFPIQIYAFTDQIELDKYEEVQSDIFDHILAIVPEFGLKIYQRL